MRYSLLKRFVNYNQLSARTHWCPSPPHMRPPKLCTRQNKRTNKRAVLYECVSRETAVCIEGVTTPGDSDHSGELQTLTTLATPMTTTTARTSRYAPRTSSALISLHSFPTLFGVTELKRVHKHTHRHTQTCSTA